MVVRDVVLLIFLYSLNTNSFAQSLDKKCLEDIKRGKFVTHQNGVENVILRKGKKQIEYFGEIDGKLISRIKWINDSTYLLTLKRCLNCPNTPLLEKGRSFTFEVIDCFGKEHYCKLLLSNKNTQTVRYTSLE